MTDDWNDQEPEQGFQSFGNIFDGMQDVLTGLQIVPDEPKVKQPRIKKIHQPDAALVKAASDIKGHPTRAERSYMARELVQCTLPLRDPKGATVWARKNGRLTLIIQSGIDEETLQPRGLPYGQWARLLLLWIITEAKATGSKHIKLGRSFTEFVRTVGGDPDVRGGKFGDAKRLKDQMLRLLDCHIDFRYNEGNAEQGGRDKTAMEIAPRSRLWWNIKNPHQDALFESELILGDEFFQSIMNNPVQVDLRVVVALKKELKQASFAIDVYIWASARIDRMREKELREVVIPLASLEQQFGAEFGRTLDFKKQLIRKLNEVQHFYPALDYKFEKGNFHLIDAGELALPPVKKAAKKRLAAINPHREINARTRSRFVRAYPEHDVETVIAAFYAWLPTSNNPDPGNMSAFFWSWAGTWTKNNPPKKHR